MTRHDKIQIGPKKKIAFVCSGGATKAGAFHLGVALALQEHGFSFRGGLSTSANARTAPLPMEISTYVGSSAGSIISSYLASGYSLDNIFNSFLGRAPSHPADTIPRVLPRITYPVMFKVRPEVVREQLGQFLEARKLLRQLMRGEFQGALQLRWLKATGLFSTAGIERHLREEVLLSNRFQDYWADLFIVATQLNHSRKVVFGKYNLQPPPHDPGCQYNNHVSVSDACAASTALPFVYSPYGIKNERGFEQQYIDGEIRDTLSSHVAVDAGADLVICSYTHQPYHFRREVGSLTDFGLPAILIQSIYLLVEQKINQYVHAKRVQREAILAVDELCRKQGVADDLRRRITQTLEEKLHHRLDVDTIYIHPKASDEKMFFFEHFGLSSKKLSELVRSGFRAGIDALRRYEFADRKTLPETSKSSIA